MAGYVRPLRMLMVDWVAGKTVSPPGFPWFVGLSTADPGNTFATIAEPTIGTGAYGRSTSITTTAGWTAAPTPTNPGDVAVSANAVAVSFPASTAAWSTGATVLTHFFLSTSATSLLIANGIALGPITPTTAVNASGITLSFAIGTLQITQDDT